MFTSTRVWSFVAFALWPAAAHIRFVLQPEPHSVFPLPCGLQQLTFGLRFNQSLDNVRMPDGLQQHSLFW